MKYSVLAALIARALIPSNSRSALAIDAVLRASKMVEEKRPEWWRWTIYIATAVTIQRILAIGDET